MPGAKLENPPLRVVLVEPQIPPKTGNVARLCAATACHLMLVGELGFDLDDSALRRAGLDYWEYVSWEHIPEKERFFSSLPGKSFHLLTTHSATPYTNIPAAWGDCLIFGKETAGLPKTLLERYRDRCYTIPIIEPRVRSLNLSSAVAIVLFDALRRVRPFPEPG